jgi:hypothetical protein
LLQGTSTLHCQHHEPFLDPPANLKVIFKQLVVPFFIECPGFEAPEVENELWDLFCWATGAVASYSFELGDDKLHVCLRRLHKRMWTLRQSMACLCMPGIHGVPVALESNLWRCM